MPAIDTAAAIPDHRGLKFDRELLYAGAMFHDIGLMQVHGTRSERFEVDGAHAAREFHMHPVVALVTAGVEMDVLGLTYHEYTDAEREDVVQAFPRAPGFKEGIIEAFYQGVKNKPETTFGNVKADVMADKDPRFHQENFCAVIRRSPWWD